MCIWVDYLAAGMVLRCAGALGKSSHRLRRLEAAQRRPAPDQEGRCVGATWREAQGHDRAVRALCLEVVSVQLLHRRKAALGCSCLAQSLQGHRHGRRSALRHPIHCLRHTCCDAALKLSDLEREQLCCIGKFGYSTFGCCHWDFCRIRMP